jgi:hypothetical protein
MTLDKGTDKQEQSKAIASSLKLSRVCSISVSGRARGYRIILIMPFTIVPFDQSGPRF